MSKRTVLVTGANGEIGHDLIAHLAQQGDTCIVALDLYPLEESLARMCQRVVQGDIVDRAMIDGLGQEFSFETVFHLAALLSTTSEYKPYLAHQVNVGGTLNVLEMAVSQGREQGRLVKVVYPGSIASYGLPDVVTKTQAGKVRENEWLTPTTMYGANKLYCEHLGRYYADYFMQLDAGRPSGGIDFRAVRFPGLVSAVTVPSGGTSDYIPEMLHHAAQGLAYNCYVRADTRIPFMAMPDGVKVLIELANAPRERLLQPVYNVTAFNPSAGKFYELLKKAFPGATISFEPDVRRQTIVDSWPLDMDDAAAREHWGWQADYDLQRTLNDYLIPTITKRYQAPA